LVFARRIVTERPRPTARVVRYLAQHHRDILTEFQKLAEMETAAA